MRAWIVWAPLLFLVACGARSDLASGASSGEVASSSSSSSSSSSTSSSSSGGGGSAGCAATPPLAVTTTMGFLSQTFVDSLAVDGANVLVATSTRVNGGSDPDNDPAWRVRLVSGDLSSMGPSQIVLTHGAAELAPGYVAAGFGHRGFLAWDSADGSRFVPLAADGSPAGPPVSLGPDVCSWLVATPGGFVAVQSGATYLAPHALLALDAAGSVLAATPLLGVDPHAHVAPGPGLIAFDDGSLLATWEGNNPLSIVAQHLSVLGEPLAEPAQLFDTSMQTTGNEFFAMASLGTSALVAWGKDASSFFTAARADEDGHAGSPTVFGSGTFNGLGLGAGGAGAFVAWAEVPDGSAVGSLLVQRTTPDGAPIGAPLPIAPNLTANAPIFAAAPAGAIVAFTGNSAGQPTQVYVTRLSCEP